MRMAQAVPALIGLAALGACSKAGGGARWSGTVTDSAGVQLVHNPAEGMWRPEDQWSVVEALRIGAAEGEPEYQFGMLAGLTVASDGRIVVLDAQGQHLKVFAPDGKYERTIGGPGGGPGEIGLGQGTAVLMGPGDTILVSDIGNQRANLYLMDGTYLRSFPLSFSDGIPIKWEATADGRIVSQVRRFAFPGSTVQPDTMDVISVRRLDGSLGDTLMRVPSGKTVSFAGGMPEWNLFSPEPLWTLLGDRVLYAVNDAYRIGVYNPGAQLERVVEKPFTLAPVTDVDQNAIHEAFQKLFVQQGVPPQMASQLLTRVHFAPNYPAFAQMMGGPDGTILVQLIRPISSLSDHEREGMDLQAGDMGSPSWEVFDGEGRLLGTLSMPSRFQPVRFSGDKIYGIQRDDLDVQYVVILNLVKPGDDS